MHIRDALRFDGVLLEQSSSSVIPSSVSTSTRLTKEITLGPDLNNNEKLQAVIPKSIWQMAKSNGAWSLVSCVVAPAFSFDGFEMAKKGWEPKK